MVAKPPDVDGVLVELLDRIPLDAQVILDVGCRSGGLGAAYKSRNPASRYVGIERDPDRAQHAVGRLDAVACVDVEQSPLPFVGEVFDCIVYGDILEHLSDPWAVLRQQVTALRSTGSIVLCIPNMEHWSFAERLLRGNWDYHSHGLMDRGHIRWFTASSVRNMLKDAGLEPLAPLSRIFEMPRAEAFVQDLSPSLVALGIEPTAYLDRCAPIQHIWRARKTPTPMLHVVSTMLSPVGGVSDVRVLEPLKALASDPSVVTQLAGPAALNVPEDAARIFIFHRPAFIGADGLEPVRRALAQNYVVVCEFDDHPDYIPILQQPHMYNFTGVHAVQTSTQELADVLRNSNDEVVVFPNSISRLPEIKNYSDPSHLTLIFAGLNRNEDWPQYLPALNTVAALAGERLHFRIVNDRALFDALQTQNKSFTPLCDYVTYNRLLSSSEISFMPLKDNRFNRCKSDLKFIEAAAHRVTALASPIAYGDTVDDGRTGIIFHDPTELQNRLLKLVANPESGRTIADAARQYVSSHRMLSYQVGRRIAWYRSLWARRDNLTQSLLERHPELRT